MANHDVRSSLREGYYKSLGVCPLSRRSCERRSECDVLNQLKANDPSVEYLEVLWNKCHRIIWQYPENKNSIGKNTHLKGLRFVGGSYSVPVELCDTRKFKEFCQGVAHNRSLKHLQLVRAPINDYTVATLTALFQNNISFESLEINDCSTDDTNRHHLASMLAHKANNLKRLVLRDLRDKDTAVIISSLGAHPNLVTIDVGKKIGRESCIALGKILENPKCKVKDLDIKNNRNLGNKCASLLGKALVINTTLKSLDMDGCDLIGTAGYQSIFFAMQSAKSSLEKLSLSRSGVNDGAADTLANALANNTALNFLNLSCIRVTAEGWVSFFTRLQNSSFHLETLDLSYAKIDNGGIDILSNVLGTNTTLKKLNLQNVHSISSEGWQRFSTFLRNNSVLEMLDVGQNDTIDDAAVVAFADTLAQNSMLHSLGMRKLRDASNITGVGWMALSQLLCNKTTIESTYSSNHTLNLIVGHSRVSRIQYPDFFSSLGSNQNDNKYEVARRKILQHHFLNNETSLNVQVFIDMELKVLPHVIAWLGRDQLGLALLLKLLQKMPSELCSRDKAQAAGAKRKRG